ncbi:MAG: flagellar hook-basal body complex protein [Magnetovibrio sp.]|nr:flagellar hook-basal body complex protein [Magnetovibrio sp.]
MISGILGAAVSGLNVNAQRIGAAADNIANANTTGYKRTSIQNRSFSTAQNSTGYAPGGVLAIARQLSDVQGLLAPSASSTDLAISGNGFFAVSRTDGGGETLFTREGSFAVNDQGFLVNNSGHYLLATTPSGEALQPVNIAGIAGTAQETENIDVGANLPARAAPGDRFTINVRATDSLGAKLDIQLNFEAQAGGTFRLSVGQVTELATGATTAVAREGSSAGSTYDVTVQFNGNGTVASFDGNATPPVLNISGLSSGAGALDIQLDLGTVGGANGLTRFGSEFVLASVRSDGASFGSVSGVNVAADGRISAVFDNGETRVVADIQVATFTSPIGLEAMSGSVYRATDASGAPTFQNGSSGGSGRVQSGALELSTTDIGTEFTNMIIAKNAYRASLAVVKAADQLSQSLLDEMA